MQKFLLLFLLLIPTTWALATNKQPLQTLFYTTEYDPSYYTATSWQSLSQHQDAINIIAPQAYHMDKHGFIWGKIDPKIIALTKHNPKVKLMPLLVNHQFEQNIAHQVLLSPTARANAISHLVAIAKYYHFYGWQLDLENVSYRDKTALNQFYQDVASALHRAGFKVSIAIVPHKYSYLHPTDYQKYVYENWSGVFDYQQLAKVSDFITLMTYDQHTVRTPPGPVASASWTEDFIRHAVTLIPREKIFLGIPTYSDYWHTASGNKEKYLHVSHLSHFVAQDVINTYHFNMQWDKSAQVHYGVQSVDGINNHLYAEDAASFAAKLQIAKRYQLGGIAVWRLGFEDPKIWPILRSSPPSSGTTAS